MVRRILVFLLPALLWAGFSTAVSAQTLVAHYKFDENGGATAADSSSTGNTGTLENGVGWDTNVLTGWVYDFGPSAALFDGVDDRMTAPDDPAINFGAGSFTISMMIKGTTDTLTDQNTLLIKGTRSSDGSDYPGSGGKRYELYARAGNIYFTVDDNVTKTETGGGSLPGATVMTGDWVHLVAVRDRVADVLHIYVDRVQEVERADSTNNSIDESTPLMIGGFWTNTEFGHYQNYAASIDDVRLYNDVLSEFEIEMLYASGTEVPAGSGASHWELY
ncbi:LamG domain-containing protein [Candidatus Sumerlaeota bacterium]|nr:LamG domain-containing protein [Candidatus Sumerlaeota bacterium]